MDGGEWTAYYFAKKPIFRFACVYCLYICVYNSKKTDMTTWIVRARGSAALLCLCTLADNIQDYYERGGGEWGVL